jgi:hypothetical protein
MGLSCSSRAALDWSWLAGNLALALGDVGHCRRGYCLAGVLLGLGSRATFDWTLGASQLLLLLGDIGDGARVEVGSHSDG